MSEHIELAKKIAKLDEGWRDKPYYCSAGYPTIGFGFRIPGTKKGDKLPVMRMELKAGLDRLDKLLKESDHSLSINKKEVYTSLEPLRKAVILSMAHQLGFSGVLGFKNMWKALEAKDYKRAAVEILDSKAAKQDAPARFKRNSYMMATNEMSTYY